MANLQEEYEALQAELRAEAEQKWVNLGHSRCPAYCTGGCCHDRHFDVSDVLPDQAGMTACGKQIGSLRNRATRDKTLANCRECVERIHG